MENSILDKIIQSKQEEEAHQFYPGELLKDLFKILKDLEKEILIKRFGLNGKNFETLEKIGQNHEITRERVRQIQNMAIRKVKKIEDFKTKLEAVTHTVNHLLQEYGGLMEEAHFLENLLSYSEDTPQNRRAALFIVSQLLDDQLEKIKPGQKVMAGWKLKVLSLDNIYKTLEVLENIIAEKNKLLAAEEIINHFKNHPHFQTNREQFLPIGDITEGIDDEKINNVIGSYLKISQRINPNILGQWGLADWQTIQPRRMGDKIYLILKKQEKPLHFTEITNLINEANFDTKVAYPATIHNELILDDRYVLVGRGIYALGEWGFRPGTVSEVIANILRQAGRPMSKPEIFEAVLKERMVKKSTVYLALTDKNKFKRVDSGYTLVE